MMESKFIEAKYKGICRGDGLTVLVGKWNKVRIAQWLEDFQSQVNEMTGRDYLQFTTEIWNPTNKMKLITEEEEEWSSLSQETRKKVKEHINKRFPFLNMKMKWENEKLLFQVYRKEDQQLKYMDQQSTCRHSTFKSIAASVYTRLSQLTSY
eukprot:2503019-Ditylum_brightwellii.AAC.1